VPFGTIGRVFAQSTIIESRDKRETYSIVIVTFFYLKKMAESGGESKDTNKDGGKPKPIFPPYSPFPYGSPLAQGSMQTSFSGSPGQRILLGNLSHARTNGEVVTPRLKGQDLYGGPVMFGGMSSGRRTRLQSSSPYGTALRTRTAERKARQGPLSLPPALGAQNTLPPSSLPSTAPSSPQSSPGPSTTPPAPLSSTAKLILSTLDRLSSGGTPITDAKKIPLSTPNRAEKRKLLETELNCSLSSPSRRRARLGGGGLALALSGPPLRKNYSPSVTAVQKIQPSLGAPSEPTTTPSEQPSGRASAAILSTYPPPIVSDQSLHPVANNPTKAKSSFKVKTKVTEATRYKVDMSSTEPPPSPPSALTGLPQLQVETMPVLNFSSTPVLPDKPPTTSNGLSAIPVPSRVPEIIEKNNNKSPLKRVIEENEICDNSKKQKSGANGENSNATVKTNHENLFCPNGPITAEKTESITDVKVVKTVDTKPPRKFRFSTPKSVIGNCDSVGEVGKIFSLSSPVSVDRNKKDNMSNGPCVDINLRLNSDIVNSSTRLVNSSTSLDTNFKFNKINSMPDVTNNLIKKSPSKEKLKGSSSRLPDITASTGFGGFVPAKELKTGSVMDILGKKA